MGFQKNDILTVTIEDIGNEGEGIGKVDGFTLFVKDAVVGDVVEAKIVKPKKQYAYARLEKVLTPSPFRVQPKCPYHRQCGGCQLQTLSYEKQLEFKQQKIKNHLVRIGGMEPDLADSLMEPIVGMEQPFHYRNKAQYPVGTDKEGKVITGFYAGRTHSIIANTNCYLGVSENQEILERILTHIRKYKISAYDETTGRGLFRHILIRKGFTSGEIMVCLVLNLPENKKNREELIPGQKELLEQLSSLPGMKSISVSINHEKTNVIMGKEVRTLWGSPVISDTIHVRDMQKDGYPFTGKELTFNISPLSFYQVNPVQTEKLYSLALEYAGLTGQETVWDLYCGIGTISLFLANHAQKVYGVEIIPQAIQDAKENAKRNGITNAEFFVGKAEEVLPRFYENQGREVPAKQGTVGEDAGEGKAAKQGTAGENAGAEKAAKQSIAGENAGAEKAAKQGIAGENAGTEKTAKQGTAGENAGAEKAAKQGTAGENAGAGKAMEQSVDMLHPDVIVVDPPRKGCDEACLNTMLKMQPERIVYVSCDSATLARDIKLLCQGGYEVKKIRGVDQFGMTVHVETVVLLSKGMVDSRKVKVDFSLENMDLSEFKGKATYEQIKAYVLEQTGLKVSSLYIAQIKKKCGLDVGENFNLPKSENAKQPQCTPEKEEAIMQAFKHFGII